MKFAFSSRMQLSFQSTQRIVVAALLGLSIFFTGAADSQARALAAPGERCAALFLDGESLVFHRLSSVESPVFSSLTPEMKSLLAKHRISTRFAKAKLRTDILFDFPSYNEFGVEKVRLGEREIREAWKGESIQSHFIAETLRELFPLAHIYDSQGQKLKVVSIEPVDYAEMESKSLVEYTRTYPLDGENFIGMPLLKMANGRAVALEKSALRRQLAISSEKFVVSIYNFDLSKIKISELITSLATVRGINPDNLVVISSNRFPFNDGGYEIPNARESVSTQAQIQMLSDLTANELKSRGPLLILNDTIGAMPILNKVANLLIVAGPVNLFEGLNAGTPTLFMNHLPNEPGTGYDLTTFKRMARAAIKSGGGFPYNNLNELTAQVPVAIAVNSKPTPSYLLKDGDKTWFEKYLDDLEVILARELED